MGEEDIVGEEGRVGVCHRSSIVILPYFSTFLRALFTNTVTTFFNILCLSLSTGATAGGGGGQPNKVKGFLKLVWGKQLKHTLK